MKRRVMSVASNGQGRSRPPAVWMATAFAALSLAGCGGGDGDDVAEADSGSADSSSAETVASEASNGGAANADNAAPTDASASPAGSDGGGAAVTVMIGDETFRYASVEPGPDDDWYTFCQVVAGSLQGTMQQIDDAGAVVQSGGFVGEVNFVLLEPGGAYESTGDSAEFQIQTADGRFLRYDDGNPIDLPASGNTASGSVTLTEQVGIDQGAPVTETVDATVDVSC